MMKISVQVVTLSNRPDRYFSNFMTSCSRIGTVPAVLDPGPTYSPFNAGAVKWSLLYNYLTGPHCPARHVLYVDSHDLLFVHHLPMIMEKFRGFGARVVISADSDCWPYKELIQRHPRTANPYRFVNSGGILGEKDAFIEMLEGLGATKGQTRGNDQGQLAIYFCENWTRDGCLALDTKGDIWTSLHFAEHVLELKNGMIRNKLSNTYPSIIHGNGGVNLDSIIEYLNL
jgi:hypothetical protein